MELPRTIRRAVPILDVVVRHIAFSPPEGTACRARRDTSGCGSRIGAAREPVHNSQPPDVAVRVEEGERLRDAVAALSPEQRAVVELRFFAGALLEDIATLLDIPLGTVKSRLHNGLERLRAGHRRSLED